MCSTLKEGRLRGKEGRQAERESLSVERRNKHKQMSGQKFFPRGSGVSRFHFKFG